MTVLISTIPTTNSTNPWSLMGVKFTPSVDIWVTKLGAWQANSSTTVKLWNSSYSEIASATVVSNSAWAYTTITTIKLTAGTVYYLTVNCTNGWSYNSQTFPFTSGSVQLNENFYTNQSTPSSYSLDNSSMYGVPSFDYVTTDPSGGGGGASNYVFTNCAATGRTGPTQAQANTTYASGNKLYNKVTIVGNGIQEFTVAKSGLHTIEAVGAKGGYQGEFASTSGGKPAKMKGDFALVAGDKLRILVGQMGTNAGSDQDAGGGGGTFVVKVDPASSYTMWDGVKVTPLIIAGGGGGDSADAQGSNASTTTSSTGSTANTSAGNGATFGNGGGGGGFLTGGQSANGGAGGASFLSGGLGGSSSYNGGFGGGAGGNDEYGAGGGGYTGGPGYDGPSGGGGSYNNGTNQLNSVDTSWQTHGQVTITEPLNSAPANPVISSPTSNGYTLNIRPKVVVPVPVDADGNTVKVRATFKNSGGTQLCQVESGMLTQGTGTVTLAPTVDLPVGVVTVVVDANDGTSWSGTTTGTFNIQSATFPIQNNSDNPGVKKTVIDSLETLVKNARSFRGLDGASEIISETISGEIKIKQSHLTAMRIAISEALVTVGVTPTWTDPVITEDIRRRGHHWYEIYNYLMQI